MAIVPWVVIVAFAICLTMFLTCDSTRKAVCWMLAAIILTVLFLTSMSWCYNSVASTVCADVDMDAEKNNGIERTITVYTADGKVIAQYTGEIGIEWNDGGYVLFDYDGKRHTYYNCFVESVADIE